MSFTSAYQLPVRIFASHIDDITVYSAADLKTNFNWIISVFSKLSLLIDMILFSYKHLIPNLQYQVFLLSCIF